MTTIAQAIAQSPLPRLETRLLLQHITGLSHSQLITRDGDLLPPEQEAQWRQLCRRREQGEPVAYLLGSREFYGRTFAVNRHVLIPRPETEHLLEAALQRLPENGVLWDLGTGSGIIAITLALEAPDTEVHAVERSPDALAVAQQNAKALRADNIHWHPGSWWQALASPRRFDLIVSNPPYIAANDHHLQQGDLRFEPPQALAAGPDGLDDLRIIIGGAPAHLNPGGWLLLEHGYDQEAPVQTLLRDAGFADVFTRRDLAGLQQFDYALQSTDIRGVEALRRFGAEGLMG